MSLKTRFRQQDLIRIFTLKKWQNLPFNIFEKNSLVSILIFNSTINFDFIIKEPYNNADGNAPLRKSMNGYESARILNPMEAQKMSVQDIEAHIDVLNETFPFINDEFVTGSIKQCA